MNDKEQTPLQAGAINPENIGTFSELQADVTEWAERVFPEGTIRSNLDHLSDKVDEIREVLMYDPDRRDLAERKIASAQLLLMHLASRIGVNLHEAALVKHGVDRKSTFGTTPGKTYWTRQ